MDDKTSTIVGSLQDDIWEIYLNNFAKNSLSNSVISDQASRDLTIVKGNFEEAIKIADTDQNASILAVYWPLELFTALTRTDYFQAASTISWNEPISDYIKLKKKYRNRLKIINGMHLFNDFMVNDVPANVRSITSLFEIVPFHKYLLARDEALKSSNYRHNIETLIALESDMSYEAVRTQKMLELNEKWDLEMSELSLLKKDFESSQLEVKSLLKEVQCKSEENKIANKEIEHLKGQVLLLQDALEKQHTKSALMLSGHSDALENQSKEFLKETESLKSEIENLKTQVKSEVEQKGELKEKLSEKNSALESMGKKLSEQESLKESLQSYLVKAQIEIEKIHDKCAQQLREADKNFNSEVRELNNKTLELQQALLASQQAVEKLFDEKASLNKKFEKKCKESDVSLKKSLRKQEKLANELALKTKALLQEKKQKQRIEQKLTCKLENAERELAILEAKQNILEFESGQLRNSKFLKLLAPAQRLKGRIFGSDKELRKDLALLYTSNLFDAKWYLECYKDVMDSALDPAEHYLKFGFKEGRQPGPNFDGNWYLKHYTDVAKKGMNPLIHFIKFGQAEGRRSSPRLLGRS